MTGLSTEKYHSGWFKRILKAGIFSGLSLIGYANATVSDSLARAKEPQSFVNPSKTIEDTLYTQKAKDYFLSLTDNLWFTNEVDSQGNIIFRGVSSSNNPLNLRHSESTEKAHTAGGILYQIRGVTSEEDLREIGRASLQSIVTGDFQILLDSVAVDSENFDIKYLGLNRQSFQRGSLTSDGRLLILNKDNEDLNPNTQIVVPKEVFKKIYQKYLENKQLETEGIIGEGTTLDTTQTDITIVDTTKYSPLQAIEFLNEQLTDTLHPQVGIARVIENSYNKLVNALGNKNILVDDNTYLINQELKNLEELLKADSSFYPNIGKRISSLADSLSYINSLYQDMIRREKDAVAITYTSPELSDYEKVMDSMDSISIKPEIRSLNLIDSLGLDSLDLVAERESVVRLRKDITKLNRTYNNYLEEDSLHSEFGPAFYDQLKKIEGLYKNRLNKLESLDKGLTTADLIRKDKDSIKRLITTIDGILTPQKKEEPKKEAKLRHKELSISLGASPYLSKNEYGADAIIDFNNGFGGVSIQGGYGIFSSIITTSHTGNPLGRNQRYLYQENERREEGLIPRVGAGISIGPLETGLVHELDERRVSERISEEVRNSDGSLYEVEDNYVKYSKEDPRNSVYGGLKIPLGKDLGFRARVEVEKGISPKYSIGLQRRIHHHNKGVYIRK